MTSKQQREALEYFKKHAGDWRAKAESRGETEVNVIGQRNRFVLRIADENPALRSFLDVGCGTGELVRDVARRGVDALGVDFAQEMIDLATRKAVDEAVTHATFVCRSIFDFEIAGKNYDLIAANGFIEYLSQPEMHAFFDRVADGLAPGGSFVVGSRNRLFNLVSMNAFTLREVEVGALELLIGEAVKWSTAKRIEDVLGADCAPLQAPATEHAKTGIDVTTRFQYTPLQLLGLLHARGLRAVEVYPVHIHGAPPSFAETNAQVHASIAELLQAHARHDTRLLVHASTFMLHVKKGI
jgi:2-polyprenyl-3-methyl-5-hydroxy-6-metoxy-1,4-benzoquinol methylase